MSKRDRRSAYDLLICIRCHDHPSFIEDTIDAVKLATDKRLTKLICAVDGRPLVARRLEKTLPHSVFCSGTRWGWGAGLYGLLAESILWAKERWTFSHFLSIDYDTLFIADNVDDTLLELISEPAVGLIGEYNSQNVHWADIFKKDAGKIKRHLGSIPRTYRAGEGVQGGAMLLTCALIERLISRGMLISPFAVAKNFTRIADDHLITLFCRMCGLEVAQIPKEFHIRWHLDCNPIGLEKKGIKVFHPTKIRPGGNTRSAELQVRNYYRRLRGRGVLK